MLIDLHNHTPLCNHATGTPQSYAAAAFAQGCKVFGFSDHAPMDFDQKYRMSFAQMPLYEAQILELQEFYKGKMEVKLGYEVDFIEDLMDARVLDAKVDFLVGSVHFLRGWGFDNPEFIGGFRSKEIDSLWQEYFTAIEASAKCGKFDIIGHIDLLKIFNHRPTKDIRLLAASAVKAVKAANLVVELNLAGLRKPCNELYPCDQVLELLTENDIDITISSDAHAAEQVGANYDIALDKMRQFGFTKLAYFTKRDKAYLPLD